MHPRERAIRERRTIEATRKNLVGSPGKLGVIARHLGKPIICQGSGLMDVTYLETVDDLPPDMPTFDDESSALSCDGWVFDGLSRGMHLEINYLDHEKKLTVSYKGFTVYVEVAGDLLLYAPFPEWEQMVERLYDLAKKQQALHQESEKGHVAREAAAVQQSLLRRLRLRWGI